MRIYYVYLLFNWNLICPFNFLRSHKTTQSIKERLNDAQGQSASINFIYFIIIIQCTAHVVQVSISIKDRLYCTTMLNVLVCRILYVLWYKYCMPNCSANNTVPISCSVHGTTIVIIRLRRLSSHIPSLTHSLNCV